LPVTIGSDPDAARASLASIAGVSLYTLARTTVTI
jgi:hypothetical protein